MDDPAAVLDEYVAHRKQRERQIMRLLAKGPAKIPDVVAALYVDTPEGLLEMARPPGARAPPEAEGRGQGHRQRRQVGLDPRLAARWHRVAGHNLRRDVSSETRGTSRGRHPTLHQR